MNIAKNLEAIFIAAAIVLCSMAYQPESAVQTTVAAQQNVPAQAAVQTVVITAKRG